MATPAFPAHFDPLIELQGVWTTRFAEDYLPIAGAPPVKYECVDGFLITSKAGPAPTGYAATQLWGLVQPIALKAGLRAYVRANLKFDLGRWIEPDFVVLRHRLTGIWAKPKNALLVGEFGSPPSRSNRSGQSSRSDQSNRSIRRDGRIDKPRMCAEAGIPYYLFGQVDPVRMFASLRLDRLVDGEYRTIAEASAGERFEITDPVRVSIDPIELLDR